MKNVKRQGDMEIIVLKKDAVKGMKAIDKTNSLTVGVGEVSGHSHLVRPCKGTTLVEYASESEVLTKEDIFVDRDELFFEVKGGNAIMFHDEHGPTVLEPGVYKRLNQVMYNPFEKRLEKVRD